MKVIALYFIGCKTIVYLIIFTVCTMRNVCLLVDVDICNILISYREYNFRYLVIC